MDTLSKTLFQTELNGIAPAPPLDAVEPLACDRWLAASALQKAIRRGDALTAADMIRAQPGADCWSSPMRTSASAASTGWPQRQCAARTRKSAARRVGTKRLLSPHLRCSLPPPRTAALTSCSPSSCMTPPLRARDRGSDRSRSIGGSNGSRIRPYRAASARSPLGILPGSRNGENLASAPATLAA